MRELFEVAELGGTPVFSYMLLLLPFMEPEGLLPCSQQPATGLCSEPVESIS
jgi:hypothetical protein